MFILYVETNNVSTNNKNNYCLSFYLTYINLLLSLNRTFDLESPMKSLGTKKRIMDAAESLFADRGFYATSLRDITTAAEVNLAAVNYYFGSKEVLLDAVLERRLGPMNTERLQMLESALKRAGEGALVLSDVLRAYMLPPFRKLSLLGPQGAKFMQLMGRMHSETHSDLRHRFVRHFETVVNEFTQAFRQALPDLPMEEVRWRMHFVIGAMAHTLVWGEWERGGVSNPDEVFGRLIGFCEAGLRATSEDLSSMKVGA
jgi:AcrR family transcriptional regulator